MDFLSKIDKKTLVFSILILAVFIIFVLSIQLIIPIISILIAFGVIAAAGYGIWRLLKD